MGKDFHIGTLVLDSLVLMLQPLETEAKILP